MRPDYDALLFDFDGVLADTEPVHHACWRAIVEPLGIPLPWEYYRAHCVGVADDVLFAKRFGAASVRAMVERKRAAFRRALEQSPPFPAETLELVRDLAARYALAVVSSSARTEVEPPMERAGIREYFRVVITCEDVARIKPAPEPYLRAAELLRARRPLVIEDSATGAAAARHAGFDLLRIERPEELGARLRARLAMPGPAGGSRIEL